MIDKLWKRLGNNATKGRLSTALGVLVIVGSVLSVFLLGRDWTDAAVGAGIGAGFIGLVHK
jgi:hypothetical protein